MVFDDRYKLIPSVYLILEKDKKVLLGRRKNTGFLDGHYGLAAGHAEADETFREAMAREAKEEIGIDIDVDNLKHVLTIHRHCRDHQRADFYFTVTEYSGEPSIAEPEKCDDLKWFSYDSLPEPMMDYIEHGLTCYRDGITYAEFDWPQV